MDNGLWLTIFGLLVGAIGAYAGLRGVILSKRSNAISKPDLKVNVLYHPQTGRGEAFAVHLHNAGGQPIHITSVHLITNSGDALNPPFDKTDLILGAADTHQIVFPLYYYELVGQAITVKQAKVLDASGKKYMLNLKKLKGQIRQAQVENAETHED